MKCKDIPDLPILKFLESLGGGWGFLWGNGGSNDIMTVMPAGIPRKLAVAKMHMLERRGLIEGCTCGCRGDFELTGKGRDYLARDTALSKLPDS